MLVTFQKSQKRGFSVIEKKLLDIREAVGYKDTMDVF
jgi:hypothetical protein